MDDTLADIATSTPQCRNRDQVISFSNLDLEQITINFTTTVVDLPNDWKEAAWNNNHFLSSAYLKVIEPLRKEGFCFYYVTFYVQNKLIGMAYYQSLPYRFVKSQGNTASFFQRYFFLPIIDRLLNLRVLVNGSVFLTGEHGYIFKPGTVNSEQIQNLIINASQQIIDHYERKTSIIILKDQLIADESIHSLLKVKHYAGSTLQPAMTLNLHPEWQSIEDYMNQMTSKYRVRVRRARKKRNGLSKVELKSEEVLRTSSILYDQYLKIAQKASFNIAYLPPSYFVNLKSSFPNRFRIFTYSIKEKLIGFYTTFHNGSVLEAHFLGFDQEYNAPYQLYLNMLYDMIEIGMESKVEKINFARTALEIKSSVGAEPLYFYSYAKHTTKWINYFIPFVIDRFEPKVKWVQRKPFKQ